MCLREHRQRAGLNNGERDQAARDETSLPRIQARLLSTPSVWSIAGFIHHNKLFGSASLNS